MARTALESTGIRFAFPERYDELIPPVTLSNLRDWIENAVSPGGFLTAVLENNLLQVMRRADLENRKALYHIVELLESYAPIGCYGSPEKVAAWKSGEAWKR